MKYKEREFFFFPFREQTKTKLVKRVGIENYAVLVQNSPHPVIMVQ